MTQAFNLSQLANKVNTSGQLDATTGLSGALPIANGGTNNASLAVTAGGVLYTDGSKVVNVGAGTTGQALLSNGSGAPTWGAAGSVGLRSTVFASSGTFTVPSGITSVLVTCIGGGGNGGSTGSYNVGGSGGAAGGLSINWVTGLTPGSTVSVTVGGAGGTSSFGAYISATGGASGSQGGGATTGGTGTGYGVVQGASGGASGASATGTGGSGAAILVNGASAIGAALPYVYGLYGSRGGNATAFGSGTGGGAGLVGGGGGGGHNINNGGSGAGGAGGAGLVIVEY